MANKKAQEATAEALNRNEAFFIKYKKPIILLSLQSSLLSQAYSPTNH